MKALIRRWRVSVGVVKEDHVTFPTQRLAFVSGSSRRNISSILFVIAQKLQATAAQTFVNAIARAGNQSRDDHVPLGVVFVIAAIPENAAYCLSQDFGVFQAKTSHRHIRDPFLPAVT